MKTVLLGSAATSFEAGLRAHLGAGHALVMVPDRAPHGEIAAALEDTAAVVSVGYDATLPPAPLLRLVQVPGIGTDGIDRAALPAGVTLCNVSGHGPAVSEFVVGALLAQRIRLCEADRTFREGSWARSSRLGGPPHGELFGKRVGIVGFGLIGREVAARLRPFGVSIAVANRTPPAADPLFDRAVPLDGLAAMAADCDILIIATALTDETRGLVGADVFAALPAGATLVNVARGPVVDEDALHAALASGRLGAAILDVWYSYPEGPHDGAARPARHDFTGFANVIMTPHISGWSEGTLARRVEEVARNLECLRRGEPLRNVVEAGA
ncbi:MAG: 2-hydroxyacid dehydrogenase [Acuticoccus sp.]